MQVISGSMDSTIRCWDLVAGRASAVLTNHKKAVRSILIHPTEYTFASASPDNIKKWKCPEGAISPLLYLGHPPLLAHPLFSPPVSFLSCPAHP
jgi:WD40 repeat protein